MEYYRATCRTNYFNVKNNDVFEKAMAKIPSITVKKEERGFFILGIGPDASGWPSWIYDEKTNNRIEIDFPALVSQFLADEEVAIFIEVGTETLRYVQGQAEAINNKGDRRLVNLNNIYQLANEIGGNITHASC
jgi:hypothetical protein